MFCLSLPIGLQDLLLVCQFATCQRLEEERDEDPRIDNKKTDDSLKITANENFFFKDRLDGSDLKINTKNEDGNDDQEDEKLNSSMIAG